MSDRGPSDHSGIEEAQRAAARGRVPVPVPVPVPGARSRTSSPEHEPLTEPDHSASHEETAAAATATATSTTMAAQREASASTSSIRYPVRNDIATQTVPQDRAPVEMRVHFDEFAAQLRSHRDQEYKRRMLEHRRNGLRKAVALSARLQRLTSWIHDGLVEIGSHHDATSFVHVHQNLQDLTDACFAYWNQHIQAMDPVNLVAQSDLPNDPEPILSKLTPEARKECFDFIHSVRSNPRFLIDRFKAVSPSQLATLSTAPRYQDLSASVLTSLSQNRGRSSQKKRVQSYSKILDDYASSFERKNPMSFLLYNCFGTTSRAEEVLRLNTWASVCAGLWMESRDAFKSIIRQVLSNFSTMRGWRAKDRLELFLMDVLQRGAFLLEPVGEYRSKAVLQTYISDTLDTDDARQFFDEAVRQLFTILCKEDGGYPLGAIEFCRALLAELPEDAQADVRSYLAFEWFLDEFLRITITYPENEKMLLQFHISESARMHILQQLWHRAQARVRDVFLPEKQRPVDPAVAHYFNIILSKIDAAEPQFNPYEHLESDPSVTRPSIPSFLTICAPDIVHVLEALSQQYNTPMSNQFSQFLTSSTSTFNSQYARANRFDRLKRELILHTEPGSTTTSVHPCHEHWMTLPLGQDGRLAGTGLTKPLSTQAQSTIVSRLGPLNVVQDAAVRIALEQPGTTLSSPARYREPTSKSLADLIFDRVRDTRSTAENVDSYHWQRALDVLDNDMSPATWMINESRILKSVLRKLGDLSPRQEDLSLEQEVEFLESSFTLVKDQLLNASMRMGRLKIKIWYTMDITNSGPYEQAKNISRALNYMALSGHTISESTHSAAPDRDRPGTSGSTTSSMFEQPRIDAMNILKASKEHGGPRKLSDEQIDMTNRWLKRSNVDNICVGEERIHRFCMEIKMATKKLVGETLSESPVLWSSELWAKEKNLFDVGPNVFNPAGSTRPSSIMSETFSSAQFSARPSIRTLDSGSRSLDADMASSPGRKASFLGFGANKFSKEFLGSDILATLSQGRSLTTTSGESISTLFSPVPSLGRSATSMSSQSRAPSIYNDFSNLKLTDPTSEKAFFLDRLQHELTCLFLSDLGNPVWSRGSETDSWLEGARENASILQCLSRRKVMSNMLPLPKVEPEILKRRKPRPHAKRWSSDDSHMHVESDQPRAEEIKTQPSVLPVPSREEQLQDVLDRLSHQVDPGMKLQAVHDFKQLALAFGAELKANASAAKQHHNNFPQTPRRQSIGPGASPTTLKRATGPSTLQLAARTEVEIVEELKVFLLRLRPSTLFRDLQYIAAFISTDALTGSEAGRAFFHMCLAARASKAEICRCMVDVASQIVLTDAIKRIQPQSDPSEQLLIKARDYWVLAAREGNAIAQRELASLYLAHPEMCSIVSLPLTLSQDIFKREMKWDDREDEANTQALCLALHWMEAAAKNEDEVAKRKLRERKETAETSFR